MTARSQGNIVNTQMTLTRRKKKRKKLEQKAYLALKSKLKLNELKSRPAD